MGVPSKHDIPALRLEFVTSKYMSHIQFFEETRGIVLAKNGGLNTKTSGRTGKKAELLKELNEKALEEAKKKIVKSVTFDKERLQIMKAGALGLAEEKIRLAKPVYERDADGKILRNEKGLPIVIREAIYLDAGEIKTLVNISKLELGEPLTVVRNEMVDLTVDEEDLEEFGESEGLTEEEMKIAEEISGLTDQDRK